MMKRKIRFTLLTCILLTSCSQYVESPFIDHSSKDVSSIELLPYGENETAFIVDEKEKDSFISSLNKFTYVKINNTKGIGTHAYDIKLTFNDQPSILYDGVYLYKNNSKKIAYVRDDWNNYMNLFFDYYDDYFAKIGNPFINGLTNNYYKEIKDVKNNKTKVLNEQMVTTDLFLSRKSYLESEADIDNNPDVKYVISFSNNDSDYSYDGFYLYKHNREAIVEARPLKMNRMDLFDNFFSSLIL